MTADGQLIVFHDDTLQRLCGLQSRVDQLKLVEIQRHLQSGHQIISLDMLAQALPLASSLHSSLLSMKAQQYALNNLFGIAQEPSSLSPMFIKSILALAQFSHIELEIKTHDRTNHSMLIEALTRYLVDSPLANLPITLTSFDRQLLAQLQRNQALRSIPRGLLVKESRLLATAPNNARQLGCSQLGIHYPLLNQSIIEHCHRYNLRVTAWTVNDIEQAKQLMHWKIDVIITDIPAQVLRLQKPLINK